MESIHELLNPTYIILHDYGYFNGPYAKKIGQILSHLSKISSPKWL